jgi:hypothetical protein
MAAKERAFAKKSRQSAIQTSSQAIKQVSKYFNQNLPYKGYLAEEASDKARSTMASHANGIHAEEGSIV